VKTCTITTYRPFSNDWYLQALDAVRMEKVGAHAYKKTSLAEVISEFDWFSPILVVYQIAQNW
jgi:hypothetical protein